MPTQVLTNARVQWGSGTGDVLPDVASVTLSYEAEALEDTVFGDTTRTHVGGLKTWSAEVEVIGDTAKTIDAYLFPKVGTIRNLRIRTSTTGIGASNPEFRGDALLTSYPIIAAGLGEVDRKSVTFESAGTLTRATS